MEKYKGASCSNFEINVLIFLFPTITEKNCLAKGRDSKALILSIKLLIR